MEQYPFTSIHADAKIGKNVVIESFTTIHKNVEIGEGTWIGPNVTIFEGARIGKNCKIFPGAVISAIPQDLKFDNEHSLFYVGDNTKIHEYVTLHRGTKETGFSKVGKNCLLMAYSHVAHDTIVGDNCILANGVRVAGHVEIEDYVIIGGLTPVHQFCKVGKHSMIGGGFRITQDVPPFILTANEPLKYKGLNLLGLRRRGFLNEDINSLNIIVLCLQQFPIH